MARVGPRKYVPGKNPKWGEGRMSENRIVWLETVIGQMVIMEYPEYSEEIIEGSLKREPGPTIRLMIPKNGRATYYNFSAMTEEELAAARTFFNLLFDKAEPVVKLRDKAARDAFSEGDDSYSRVYRPVPRLVIREGAVGRNSKSLRDRHEDVPEGDRPAGDPEGGVRGSGDELVDGESQSSGPEDNQPSAD